jgi:predicted metal-binding membrane protein
MAALFAVGVMNVTWMIVIAALVAVEKLLPSQRTAIGATALIVAVLGLAVAFAPGHVPALTIPGMG